MKSTGKEYLSTKKMPEINPAFSELLPPLPDEQYAQLEADIRGNGCYCPVVVNENMEIVDGHHRYNICNKYDIPFRIVVFSFENVLEAQQWALDTQKARRNLSAWELGQIAIKLKPAIEEKGKENMAAGGGDKVSSEAKASSAILPNPVDTRKVLADAAGLGERTMGKIMQIDENAPESVKEAMNNGMSINKGYEITKQIKNLPVEERDEAAKAAIAHKSSKKEEQRKNKVVDDRARIAKRYCTAFEKAVLIEANETNVRIWIEWAGIRKDEIIEMLRQAKTISESFSNIATVLETIYEGEVKPYEDKELMETPPIGDTGDSQKEDTGEAKET